MGTHVHNRTGAATVAGHGRCPCAPRPAHTGVEGAGCQAHHLPPWVSEGCVGVWSLSCLLICSEASAYLDERLSRVFITHYRLSLLILMRRCCLQGRPVQLAPGLQAAAAVRTEGA